MDSNLSLTCTTIDLICELLTGIASNNALQQEAVVRWTKLLLGNISEPILQVRVESEKKHYIFYEFFITLSLLAENDSVVV